MSQDFAFSDLGRVHWGSTVKLALSRGFFAGIVWAFAVSFGPNAQGTSAFLMPFLWALFGLPAALFVQFVGSALGALVSSALGLFVHFVGSLLICVGDPFVYLLNRQFPALLNIADLNFINFRPMIFITYPN